MYINVFMHIICMYRNGQTEKEGKWVCRNFPDGFFFLSSVSQPEPEIESEPAGSDLLVRS